MRHFLIVLLSVMLFSGCSKSEPEKELCRLSVDGILNNGKSKMWEQVNVQFLICKPVNDGISCAIMNRGTEPVGLNNDFKFYRIVDGNLVPLDVTQSCPVDNSMCTWINPLETSWVNYSFHEREPFTSPYLRITLGEFNDSNTAGFIAFGGECSWNGLTWH